MGRCLIRELTGKQSMDQEKSWNTVVVREVYYIHCDAWSRTAPEMISSLETISISLHVDPEMTPN